MRMVHYARTLHIIAWYAILGSGVVQASFGVVESFTFMLDDRFSQDVAASIISFVEKTPELKTMRLADIAHAVATVSPGIQRVVASYNGPTAVRLSVSAHTPLFSLNKKEVLVEDGAILDAALFVAKMTEALPQVRLKRHEDVVSAPCLAFLKKVPADFFEHYYISWNDAADIRLCEKKKKNFSIKCCADFFPEKKILRVCDQIKQELDLNKKLLHRSWIADVRFTNQVVLYSDTGGRRYG